MTVSILREISRRVTRKENDAFQGGGGIYFGPVEASELGPEYSCLKEWAHGFSSDHHAPWNWNDLQMLWRGKVAAAAYRTNVAFTRREMSR